MGLINDFIDCLDKKWGEQAMQKKINEKDELLAEKDELLAEKDELLAEKDRAIEALREERAELLRIRENRAKADAAWERAFAERTSGTVRSNPLPVDGVRLSR